MVIEFKTIIEIIKSVNMQTGAVKVHEPLTGIAFVFREHPL